MTEWRTVLDGRYDVSDKGHVRGRIKRKGTWWMREIKGSLQDRGYLRIHSNELRKDFYIHRLVAEAFLGPCPVGLEVNHKNGDKSDNRVENLEYITHGENNTHAARLGLCAQGEATNRNKITADQVREIRALSASGCTQNEIASRFGIHQMQVSRIVRRVHWKSVK